MCNEYLTALQPTAAVEDCSRALELEPGNIKALYRRGVARKVSQSICTVYVWSNNMTSFYRSWGTIKTQ